MKKSRLFVIITVFIVLIFVLLLSSSFFTLAKIEINFVDNNNKKVSLSLNKKIRTQKQVEDIVSSANFDYGSSIFLLDKNKYSALLEYQNPYLKIVNVFVLFPNKLCFEVKERNQCCFFLFNNYCYLFDEDFKLLEILQEKEIEKDNFLNYNFYKNNLKINYFNFFNLSPLVLSQGDFLTENNLVFKSIQNFYKILGKYFTKKEIIENFKCFNIVEVSSGKINLEIITNENGFGVNLIIEDILSSFDKKFDKLINAFITLCCKEKIKTTYGILKINNNFNCYWNNL